MIIEFETAIYRSATFFCSAVYLSASPQLRIYHWSSFLGMLNAALSWPQHTTEYTANQIRFI